MISLNKLKRLPEKTRLRKIVQLLRRGEEELLKKIPIDERYYLEILKLASKDLGFKKEITKAITVDIRLLNEMRYRVQSELGITVADWDFIEADAINGEDENAKIMGRKVFPIEVFLEDIRSPYNVGAIFRTAEAFGVERIMLTDITPPPTHRRASRTSRNTHKLVPWKYGRLEEIEVRREKGTDVFALEEGGVPVSDFSFPESGIVLIGSEELGLSPEALELAKRSKGIISIPMMGLKRSLNVSVAFGILVYLWSSFLDKNRTAPH